jgi:ribA/ribD-fused uncharacterized protein
MEEDSIEKYFDAVTKFYMGRARKPKLFRYDDDGNGNIYEKEKGKKSKLVKSFNFQTYRSLTKDEIDEMEQVRKEAIANAESKLEDAILALRDMPEDSPKSEILRKQKKIQLADMNLLLVRYPLRNYGIGRSYPKNKILFSESRDVRVLQNIVTPMFRPFTLQEMYVREGEPIKQAPKENAPVEEAPKEKVILFSKPDGDYGFLSMGWPVIITIGENTYNNAYQAIMGEMANFYGDVTAFEEIMSAKSPDEITYNQEKAGVEPETWNGQLDIELNNVMRAKFTQHPELLEQLLQTGHKTLGACLDDNTIFGIGLSYADPKAKDSSKWTGKNRLGKVLRLIRREAREAKEAQEAMAVAQAVAQPIKIKRKKTKVEEPPKVAEPKVAEPDLE